MKNQYELRIHSDNSIVNFESIFNISFKKDFDWEYKVSTTDKSFRLSIIENEEDKYFDYITYFTDLIKDRLDLLKKIGIKSENITIRRLYEYSGQCNMEWSSKDLNKLGDVGVSLCVSCWESE